MAFAALAALAAMALYAAAPARAQDKTDLLTGKQVTEKNLVDALTPKPDEPAAPGLRTRSLKVGPAASGASGSAGSAGAATAAASAPSAAAGAAGAARPSASLLITFRTNSTELTPQARQTVDVVARALQADKLQPFTFTLEGHADPRGNAQANLALSQGRAESVRAYLIEKHGIDQGRLQAVGKGDREPMNSRNPAAPENRRVTIVTNVN
jgi:outer membrane protein OmpA-like peptidoglycan-associated protein